MKRLGRAASFFLIGFSLLIITSSLKIGVGSLQAPGPGFMGFLSSLLLLSLSLVILVRESVKSAKEMGEGHFGWQNLSGQLIVTAALCGYALLLDTLGFLFTGFILISVMLLINNPRKWYWHLIVAFIVINVSYFVFCKWLRVLLPVGVFRIRW